MVTMCASANDKQQLKSRLNQVDCSAGYVGQAEALLSDNWHISVAMLPLRAARWTADRHGSRVPPPVASERFADAPLP